MGTFCPALSFAGGGGGGFYSSARGVPGCTSEMPRAGGSSLFRVEPHS